MQIKVLIKMAQIDLKEEERQVLESPMKIILIMMAIGQEVIKLMSKVLINKMACGMMLELQQQENH